MENSVSKINIINLVPSDIPGDVVEIDILYKETNSPNIYVVDTIKPTDDYWSNISFSGFQGSYEIESEVIYGALSSSQILRSWDNVPRLALAQEVTGNRIVYGNYLQNYDIGDLYNEFKVDFQLSLSDYNPHDWNDYRSVKTQREYQVGISYLDKYGRETPIFTDKTGVIKSPKSLCNKTNRIEVKVKNDHPSWADSYKLYIKETSNEYYNLIMDRWYDAEDGNIWLSFYSHERNKISEESWIELKKGTDNLPVTKSAKYKVLAIENEAPDYIKLIRKRVINMLHVATAAEPLFNDDTKYPLEDRNFFSINADALIGGPAEDLHQM